MLIFDKQVKCEVYLWQAWLNLKEMGPVVVEAFSGSIQSSNIIDSWVHFQKWTIGICVISTQSSFTTSVAIVDIHTIVNIVNISWTFGFNWTVWATECVFIV